MRRIAWLLVVVILLAGCVEEAATPSFPDIDPKDLVPELPPTTKVADEPSSGDAVDSQLLPLRLRADRP